MGVFDEKVKDTVDNTDDIFNTGVGGFGSMDTFGSGAGMMGGMGSSGGMMGMGGCNSSGGMMGGCNSSGGMMGGCNCFGTGMMPESRKHRRLRTSFVVVVSFIIGMLVGQLFTIEIDK